MTSRFPPFAFVELVSPYNKKNITRWLEDMNFMFSWQEQYLTRSLRSLVRCCSCHSNIKFISSRHRVISSIYTPYSREAGLAQWWERSPPTNVTRGSIPGPGVIFGLSLLLVLYSAPRGFSPGTPVFPFPQKPTFPNSNSIWSARTFLNEFFWTPWIGTPWVDKLYLHLHLQWPPF